MKKIIPTILGVFLLFALMTQSALGANNVSEIYVDVGIYDDGSAYITQTWNGNFNEGTECYFPIENLGEMKISEFLVSDINGPYTYVEDWDIDAGFQEKVGKCGIVKTKQGYELCWGISEYGEHRYAIEYKIDKFVGGYQDYDGFNFQFINSGMGTLPTDVTIKITMQDGIKLDQTNAGIWAFGFNGQINFAEGQVVAYTESPLSLDHESVIIMVQLNKGLINPERVEEQSFETVKTEAFKGSDYDYGNGTGGSSSQLPGEDIGLLGVGIGSAMIVLPFVGILYFLIRRMRRNKKIKTLYKNADYFREAPIKGNLEGAFVLAEAFKQTDDEGHLIGAAFLKLINAGSLESMNEKTVGFFGREKESISLRLVHPPQFNGVTTMMLYNLLILASGTDQILQEKELEKYCRKNHQDFLKIIEGAKNDGKKTLIQMGSYDKSKQAKPLGLSEQGENSLLNLMGFKKYLLEFSLIGERSIAETIIWQDYLIFATLLGIADKAIAQFEKVYPDATRYSEAAHYNYMLANRYTMVSYQASQQASQKARSSGSGGSSSGGGGGGFSGGGSGGGTR